MARVVIRWGRRDGVAFLRVARDGVWGKMLKRFVYLQNLHYFCSRLQSV